METNDAQQPFLRPAKSPLSFKDTLLVAVHYVMRDLRRNRRVFGIGLSAVAIVVFFVVTLQNIILQSPIIFFRLSEETTGEVDILLTPSPEVNSASIFINHTQVSERISLARAGVLRDAPFDYLTSTPEDAVAARITRDNNNNQNENGDGDGNGGAAVTTGASVNLTAMMDPSYDSLVNASAPRWLMLGTMINRDEPWRNGSARVVILDTKLEEDIELGRQWPHRRLGEEEVHIAPSLLRAIGIHPNLGERVVLRIDLIEILQTLTGADDETTDTQLRALLDSSAGLDNTTFQQFEDTLQGFVPLLQLFGEADLPSQITVPRVAIELVLAANGIDIPEGTEIPSQITLPPQTTDAQAAALDLAGNEFVNITGAELRDLVVAFVRDQLVIEQELRVVDAVGTAGKWPNSIGNVAAIDSKYLGVVFRNQIERTYRNVQRVFGPVVGALLTQGLNVTEDELLEQARSQRFDDFALLEIIQFRGRTDTYLRTGADLRRAMVKSSDATMEALGQGFPASPSLPVYLAIEATSLIRLFLDQLLLLVILVLAFLGALLIHQLVVSDADAKTYEYGMLRALGLGRLGLGSLLGVQTTAFSFPGIAVGLFTAFLACIYPTRFIADFGKLPAEYGLRGQAVGLGIGIGIGIPFFSNILPIRRALGKSLRDSLDVYHATISEVSVTFTRLEAVGLDTWQVAIALVMITTGFTVYYMFPYAIVFNNFALLLTLLLLILLGMVFGFVLLSQVLLPRLERVVQWCIVLPRHRHLMTLLRGNASAHAARNSKAALMFTTSLSFVIFAGTMFSIQAASIPDNLRIIIGSDVVVTSSSYDLPLAEDNMRAYLQGIIDRDPDTGAARSSSLVQGFAFQTYQIRNWEGVRRGEVSTLARFPDYEVPIYGVDEEFLAATYADVFIATETESGVNFPKTRGITDPIRSLYTSPLGKDGGEAFANVGKAPSGTPVTSGVDVQNFYEELVEEYGPPEPLDPPPSDDSGSSGDTSGSSDDGSGSDSGDDNGGGDDDGGDPFVPPNDSGSPVIREEPLEIRSPDFQAPYINVFPMIVSESLREPAGVDTNTPLSIEMVYRAETEQQDVLFRRYNLGRARAMVRKVPGFYYSAYRFAAGMSPVLVSMDVFYRLMKVLPDEIESGPRDQVKALKDFPDKPPKSKLFIKLRDDASLDERESVINGIKSFIDDDITEVTDTVSVIAGTQNASRMINLFFTIAGTIALSLATFVLLTAFTSNVRENQWEYGVQRALGVTVARIQAIYMYEALSLVISSLLMGTVIGLILAITLTLQFNVFLEAPFAFNIPGDLYATMIVMSLSAAVLGSYFPVRSLGKVEIAQVIRGGG